MMFENILKKESFGFLKIMNQFEDSNGKKKKNKHFDGNTTPNAQSENKNEQNEQMIRDVCGEYPLHFILLMKIGQF